MIDTVSKDPAAILDYLWNWAARLRAGETIIDATVTCAEDGITIAPASDDEAVDYSTDHDGTTVTAWLADGVVGVTYDVVCHIRTSAGREDEHTLPVFIIDR